MVTKNYIRGVPQNAVLVPIDQSDGSAQYIRRDDVHVNGIAEPFTLYADAGGSSPLPNDSYSLESEDAEWTDRESALNGGLGKTIYSQIKVSDATYQGVDLWASFQDYGTYTDNDAPYSMVGGALTVDATGTISPSTGYLRQIITADTSLGAITLTVDPPEFIGQEIYLLCDGSGLLDVDFDGKLATGNVVVSDGLMLRLTAKSLTEWQAVNEVTADYVSGGDNAVMSSAGSLVIKVEGVTIGGFSYDNAPIVSFTEQPFCVGIVGIDEQATMRYRTDISTSTRIVISPGTSSTQNFQATFSGKY